MMKGGQTTPEEEDESDRGHGRPLGQLQGNDLHELESDAIKDLVKRGGSGGGGGAMGSLHGDEVGSSRGWSGHADLDGGLRGRNVGERTSRGLAGDSGERGLGRRVGFGGHGGQDMVVLETRGEGLQGQGQLSEKMPATPDSGYSTGLSTPG